jgi:DNA-binding NtrC family response regulator
MRATAGSFLSANLREDVACAAACGANVLISGGNEVSRTALARYLHRLRHRADDTFMVINRSKGTDCANVMGYACGGTLFLEELTDLNGSAPLVALIELCIRQRCEIGDAAEPPTRIISATDRMPAARTGPVAIRSDLFYWLNTIHLVIPDTARAIES